MDDKLFDTPEKIADGLSALKSLIIQPGWLLLEKVLDANIEVVSNEILNGFDGDTKEQIDRLRDRLKILKEVKNNPHAIISKLEPTESGVPDADPFYTVESLRAMRNENS